MGLSTATAQRSSFAEPGSPTKRKARRKSASMMDLLGVRAVRTPRQMRRKVSDAAKGQASSFVVATDYDYEACTSEVYRDTSPHARNVGK